MLTLNEQWSQPTAGRYLKLVGDVIYFLRVEFWDANYLFAHSSYANISEIRSSRYLKYKSDMEKELGKELATELVLTDYLADVIKDYDYHEFSSLDDLSLFLREKDFPSLSIPENVPVSLNWHKRSVGSHTEVFIRRINDNDYETVYAHEIRDTYSVAYEVMCNYSTSAILECLWYFICDERRNPQDLLELLAYESTDHGSSFKDKVDRGLESKQAAEEIMRDTYGILNVEVNTA